MSVVLDSSAMIAWLTGEPEGEAVKALFSLVEDEAEGIEIYAHATNLAEVYYHVLADQDTQTAEEAIELLLNAGTVERRDIDGVFWRDMATLINQARATPADPNDPSKRLHLALGDAYGVTLANRMGADFVTKDRAEIEPLHKAKMVSAIFIR